MKPTNPFPSFYRENFKTDYYEEYLELIHNRQMLKQKKYFSEDKEEIKELGEKIDELTGEINRMVLNHREEENRKLDMDFPMDGNLIAIDNNEKMDAISRKIKTFEPEMETLLLNNAYIFEGLHQIIEQVNKSIPVILTPRNPHITVTGMEEYLLGEGNHIPKKTLKEFLEGYNKYGFDIEIKTLEINISPGGELVLEIILKDESAELMTKIRKELSKQGFTYKHKDSYGRLHSSLGFLSEEFFDLKILKSVERELNEMGLLNLEDLRMVVTTYNNFQLN